MNLPCVLTKAWGIANLGALAATHPPSMLAVYAPAIYFAGSFFKGNAGAAALFVQCLGALVQFQLNNTQWPVARLYDTWIFVAAAVAVVWLNRARMMRRGDSITRVVPLRGPTGQTSPPDTVSRW